MGRHPSGRRCLGSGAGYSRSSCRPRFASRKSEESFGDDKIDDDALAKPSLAENVIELEIGFSDVTDEGLAIVSTMPNLEKLYLQKTGISDDALTHLEGLNHLALFESIRYSNN